MRASTLLVASLAVSTLGCSGGSEASVSADEERMFKNPPPVDRSKIPADAFPHNGPSYVGEPSKGSGSAPPPAAATAGG